MADKPKRARRGWSEGSIYQRPNGQWVGMVSLGVTASGKRRRKAFYGDTKTEVMQQISKERGKASSRRVEASKMTVGEFLDFWLVNSAKPTVKPSTLASYEDIVRLHIRPTIGKLKLSKLTSLDIQSLYTTLQEAGKSARCRQQVHAVLHRALSRAVRWKMLPENACESVDRPTVAKREMKYLEPEQMRTFLAAAKTHQHYAMYVLAVTTGLRQGELFALKWSDIDFENSRLSVLRTLVEIKGKLSIGEPKSAKGKRRLSLPAVALDALHDHRKQMLALGFGGSELLFLTETGRMLTKANAHRSFCRLLKRANLPRIRFHDLRHSNAVAMLTSGVHPKVAQERLGHSQIAMTLDTYSHVLESVDRDAADKLAAVFTSPAVRKTTETG